VDVQANCVVDLEVRRCSFSNRSISCRLTRSHRASLQIKKMKVLNRIAKLCIGCYILILGMILVIIPNVPLIGLLLACKYIEAYAFYYLYGAEAISNYDFLKLSTGVDKNVRTTLVVIDGKLELKAVKELVVTSLLDAHTVDGELCFSQLTKRHVSGMFNNYWVEEEQFSLTDHVEMWGEESVYTTNELQQILVRLKDENVNVAISPWSLTVIPLQYDKTAIAFRCHPALRDLVLLRTLLNGHKVCDHESIDFKLLDEGFLHLVKHLSLSCWNLAEYVFNTFTSKSISPSKDSNVRKVLMWSKPMDSKMFKEMARNLNVGITEVLLGCVSYIVNDLDSLNYECPLSIADASSATNISSTAFPIKSGSDDPVSTIIKSKEKLADLSLSGKLFTSLLFERIANLIMPIRLAKFLRERITDEVKVNINTLLEDEKDESALSLPVDLISVWCEENKESAIEICLTNTMGKLIIATDAHHTQQSTSQNLFQQFDQVVNKLAAETGVFTHYYQ